MHKIIIVLFAVIALSLNSEARILSRCEVVWALRRQEFPANQLRDWVCLIEAASGRKTGYVSPPSNTGSRGWGLFKIWDTVWCSTTSVPGKDCNVRCVDIITPDITRASHCARLVHSRHGFRGWTDWTNNCRSQLPDISYC